MYDFLLLALLAGLAVAVVAGPLGCLVVWQRMAYFGDTLAHSALLGVALGLWLSVGSGVAVTLVCLAVAAMLTVLERKQGLATDTLLGILAHTFLAGGNQFLVLASSTLDHGQILVHRECDKWPPAAGQHGQQSQGCGPHDQHLGTSYSQYIAE